MNVSSCPLLSKILAQSFITVVNRVLQLCPFPNACCLSDRSLYLTWLKWNPTQSSKCARIPPVSIYRFFSIQVSKREGVDGYVLRLDLQTSQLHLPIMFHISHEVDSLLGKSYFRDLTDHEKLRIILDCTFLHTRQDVPQFSPVLKKFISHTLIRPVGRIKIE